MRKPVLHPATPSRYLLLRDKQTTGDAAVRHLIDDNLTFNLSLTSTAGKLMMLSGLLALGLMIAGTQPVAAGDTHRHGAHDAAHDAKTPQRACPDPAPVQAAAKKPNAGTTGQIVAAPRISGGMRAHIDPATGEFVDAPVEGSARTTPPAQLIAPAQQEPLVEIPTADGGFLVNTGNRFNKFLTATIGPDGKTVFQHEPCDPGTNAKR
jgi:hypothetical protein